MIKVPFALKWSWSVTSVLLEASVFQNSEHRSRGTRSFRVKSAFRRVTEKKGQDVTNVKCFFFLNFWSPGWTRKGWIPDSGWTRAHRDVKTCANIFISYHDNWSQFYHVITTLYIKPTIPRFCWCGATISPVTAFEISRTSRNAFKMRSILEKYRSICVRMFVS